MIPCFICGKDASTGWTKGFSPAPDSQKLALCAEHNTPENRLAVANAWQALLEREIAVMTGVAEFKTSAPSLQTATVHFTGGGMLSFICLACSPTEQGTLCIETPDGARNFVPMQHVREYSVRPYASSGSDIPVANGAAGIDGPSVIPVHAKVTPSFPASSVHPVAEGEQHHAEAPSSFKRPGLMPEPLAPVDASFEPRPVPPETPHLPPSTAGEADGGPDSGDKGDDGEGPPILREASPTARTDNGPEEGPEEGLESALGEQAEKPGGTEEKPALLSLPIALS